MSKLEKIEAVYRIVTPMFIGDSEQNPSGVSAASVKGALRFWWRALNWGRIRAEIRKDYQNDEANNCDETALRRLHEEEAELFGSSAYDNKQRVKVQKKHVGQSKILLHIKQPSNLQSIDDWPVAPTNKTKPQTDSNYLGMGLWETKETSHRKALLENQNFILEIVCRNLNDLQKKQLLQTLKIIGLVGGLGGRSRRAFGAISIECIDGVDYKCTTVEQYTKLLSTTLIGLNRQKEFPPYTAFSQGSMLATTQFKFNNARTCHARIGAIYKSHRGKIQVNDREVFGLPIVRVNNKRRASPLFFHVHPLGARDFVGLALFIPSEPFHYDGSLKEDNYSLVLELFEQMDKVELA